MAISTKVTPDAKNIVIIGASSGIGRNMALRYLEQNPRNIIGITGRRTDELKAIKAMDVDRVCLRTMDVQNDDCAEILDELIGEMGGMDLIIYCAGVGFRSPELEAKLEMLSVGTHVDGFTRIAIRSYNYFKERGGGQIATISSLAGLRPLRQSPAYSATKRYQSHYMSCLAQRAHHEKLDIRFTTIMPGFIDTPLLKYKYPFVVSVDKGAGMIFKAIEKKRRRTIIPHRWRIIAFLWRLVPFWEKIW